ncbi:MAG TPA: hypothetical protein VII06_41820 [Chloroflexota bacterium]|jgi:hypothetical protein
MSEEVAGAEVVGGEPPVAEGGAAGVEGAPIAAEGRGLESTVVALMAERDAAREALLAAHRRALLAEHRGQVVEALVQGDSVEALDASVARAHEAHARIAEQLRSEAAASVPVGNPPRAQPRLDGLSPQAKIAAALRRR